MDLTSKTLSELGTLEANARASTDRRRADQVGRILHAVEEERTRRRAAVAEQGVARREDILSRVQTMGLEARVTTAFREAPPTAAEIAAIKVLYHNPGSTTEELSKLLGAKGNTFNAAFGRLCRTRQHWLGDPLPEKERAGQDLHAARLADIEPLPERADGEKGAARKRSSWRMKPEVGAAMERLGLVRRTPPNRPTRSPAEKQA